MISRRSTLLATLLAAAVLFPRASLAQDCAVQGEVTGWTIRSFVSDYEVQENGEIEVVERIEVDFDRHQRHGIFRVIPVKYRRLVREDLPIAAGTVSYDLDFHRVVDGAGQPYEYEVSNDGANKRIRIGSPDFCVTGVVTYIIHYRLSGGLGFFDDFDELYWQVTGTYWPVPIENAEATVRLPTDRALMYADSLPWQAHCYAGWADSTSDEDCTVDMPSPGYYRFAATRTLVGGQGLTFAAGFPKGVIPGPTPTERALDAFLRYGPLAIPFLAFGILLAVWRRYGKEPAMGSIAPQWHAPDGFRPGPAGALVDQRADMDDVIATVLDLAVRGWIQIREVPPTLFDADSLPGKILGALGLDSRDWEIVRLGKDFFGLEPFEIKVLEGILDGKDSSRLSDLKHEFYKVLPEIKKEIYDDLVERRLFARSPQTTRNAWLVLGLVLTIGGVALGMIGLAAGFWALLPALVLSGIVTIAFSIHMPRMTPAGAALRRHLEGLEEYIRRAEKAEMEFKDAPAKTPELFSELLPYAVALDVSDLWVEQFRGILTQPPGWYAGTWTGSGPTGGWDLAGFRAGLGDFRSAASSTLQSAPGGSSGSGSGGGGSVGGGGGGGGGGSW